MGEPPIQILRRFLYFTLIALAWSWAFTLPLILGDKEIISIPTGIDELLLIPAGFGPFVAAFILSYRVGGRPEVQRLWSSGWRWSFPLRWYAAILLIPLGLVGVTYLILLTAQAGGPLNLADSLNINFALPTLGLSFFVVALPQEYGWRGFSQRRLTYIWNPLLASILTGLIWGIWQLPAHWVSSTPLAGVPAGFTLLSAVLSSILYAWIFEGSRGSVAAAALFHALITISNAILPVWSSPAGRWIYLLLLLILAGFAVWRGRMASLERPGAYQPEDDDSA